MTAPDKLSSEEDSFTSAEVCELAGITFRQLDYWTTNGWINSIEENTGTGKKRHYTHEELRTARIMRWLTEAHILPKFASVIARAMIRDNVQFVDVEIPESPLAVTVCVIDPRYETILVVPTDSAIAQSAQETNHG